MKETRFTEPQIMAVLREAESGVAVPAVCRTHGIRTVSFYKWLAKYGGMDASMMSHLKAMEEENRRLKRIFADLSMQADLLREALEKSNTAGSAPNAGREGSGDTWCRHSAGMSGFWGQ